VVRVLLWCAEGLRGPGSSMAFPTSTRLRSGKPCNGPWGSSCHRHRLAGESRWAPGFRCTRIPRCTAMTDKAEGRLCRYGARGPVSKVSPASPGRRAVAVHAQERSHLHADGKRPWCAAWSPWCRKAKVHLTSFHGVYAPHAALRPRVTMPPPPAPPAPPSPSKKTKKTKKTKPRTTRRLDFCCPSSAHLFASTSCAAGDGGLVHRQPEGLHRLGGEAGGLLPRELSE